LALCTGVFGLDFFAERLTLTTVVGMAVDADVMASAPAVDVAAY
jgi:hypothetical protein